MRFSIAPGGGRFVHIRKLHAIIVFYIYIESQTTYFVKKIKFKFLFIIIFVVIVLVEFRVTLVRTSTCHTKRDNQNWLPISPMYWMPCTSTQET